MDKLQLVKFPFYAARDQLILDLNDGVYISNVRDTFKVTPPVKNQQFSQSQQQYGGSNLANETHDNGMVEAECYITGTTKNDSIVRMENMISLFENFKGYYIKWQPDGASYPVFYEIKANMPYDFLYRWIEYNGQKTLHVKWQLAVAPLAEGYGMYANDGFDTTLGSATSDYYLGDLAADAGGDSTKLPTLVYTAANPPSVPAIATYTAPSNASPGFMGAIENLRQYPNEDNFVSLVFSPVTSLTTGQSVGVFLRWVDKNNYISVEFTSNGTTTTFAAYKCVAGVRTSLGGGTNGSFNMSNAYIYNLDAVIKGREFSYRMYRQPLSAVARYPTNGSVFGTPPTGATIISGYNPGPTDPGVLPGAGRTGFFTSGTSVAMKVYNFSWSSYVNTDLTLNGTLPNTTYSPNTPIPGSAPAKVDSYWETGSTASPFAAFAWGFRPNPWNMLKNGNFDVDSATFNIDSYYKWATGAYAPYSLTAATSTTVNTAAAISGTYGLQGVFPVTNKTALTASIKGEFKGGRTYRFSYNWAYLSGGSFAPGALIGASVGGSSLGYAAADGATTVDFTLPKDADTIILAIYQTNGGGAPVTAAFDNIAITEVGAAPGAAQQSGRMGHPTMGPLLISNGEIFNNNVAGISAGAAGNYGSSMNVDTGNLNFATGWTAGMGWWVDHTLLDDDKKTLTGETTFEVWAYLSALPATVQGPSLSAWVKSGEVGLTTNGTNIHADTGVSGIAARVGLNRIGTITISRAQLGDEPRYRLYIGLSFGAGSSGTAIMDWGFLLPTARRAASPTAIAYDSSTYPAFLGANQGKLIRSDGTAFIRSGTVSEGDLLYPDHALGGSLMRLWPGKFQVNALTGSAGPGTDTSRSLTKMQFLVTPRYYLARGQ